MFFNYDLFEIVSIAFIVSGILTYSLYNSSGTINNSKSLVNTLSNSDVSDNLSTTQLIDVGVQTEANTQVEASVQAVNTYVNTGMQTSARMWLESISNWITEILGTTSNPQYVDVGVQTNATSLWTTVKQWFLDVCSVRSSELSSIGYSKVNKWINKLNPSTVESNHTITSAPSQSSLQQLVNPDDSASNISEVISVNNLQTVPNTAIPYNINEVETYNHLIVLPDVKISNVIIDGVQEHFIILGDAILAINPAIMNMNHFI